MTNDIKTIKAQLKPLDKIPENYNIQFLKEPVQFMQEYKPWAVYTREESDPVRIKLTEQVNKYNTIVKAILETPGFIVFL